MGGGGPPARVQGTEGSQTGGGAVAVSYHPNNLDTKPLSCLPILSNFLLISSNSSLTSSTSSPLLMSSRYASAVEIPSSSAYSSTNSIVASLSRIDTTSFELLMVSRLRSSTPGKPFCSVPSVA
ncbi:ORF9 [Halorubrum pleomorphic virus 1]|uniref:Uncharacterized protein 9 n=1 Tax=Halorubrum pleomorphic virus 1 TaxID=634168 RepID=ORF9_HAPV1|nr:hypothetical protein HRPV-1_gp9 [Halorubrum pleomorphic virus 1]C1JJY8.1 RecName: Full=Uncharacterized protein 9 [Halorubrum pleomorphic virus 1]ACO54904.1 ORF9 [Halorubrum pleomorphic virus 1]